MLKLAGVKTEAAFYKKYPTQEAFMKVHGKAFKKAQIGTYIGGDTAAKPKLLNYQDAYDQGDMSVTGKTDKMRQEEAGKQAALAANTKQAQPDSGGTLGVISKVLGGVTDIAGQLMKSEAGGGDAEGMLDMLGDARYGKRIPKAQIGRNLQPIGQNLTPAGMAKVGPQVGQAQTFNTGALPNSVNPAQASTLGKIGGAIGKYAGPVGDLIGGLQALKAEKAAVKGAQQTRQLSDLSLQASNTKPEQTQRKYVRPEDMVTSGNQVAPTQGTGTNILAEDGASVKGKPKKGKKVDVRKETDVIKLPSWINEGDVNYLRTTGDKEYKALKSNMIKLKPVEKQGTQEFVSHFENPEVVRMFAKNTGQDPKRLQDAIGKSLRTPIEEFDSQVEDPHPLDFDANAVFRDPHVSKSKRDMTHPETGYIKYKPQGTDAEGLYYADSAKDYIGHERVHASGLDVMLAPALYRALDKKLPTQRGGLDYYDRPEEVYGNFYEFRKNLGLKPGQKVTRDELKKMIEFDPRTKSNSTFLQKFLQTDEDLYGPNFYHNLNDNKKIDKVVNAINTVAYNPNNNEDVTYAQDGAEIQNTYAPDTLYDDLGYEPLEDSTQIKQYQAGGNVPWDMISDKATGLGQDLMGGQNAGGQIGKTAGKAIGNMIVPGLGGAIGGFVGGIAGQALDPNAKRLAREQEATGRNMQAMAFGTGVQGLQAQNTAVMEDGGYVSNDWTPQVITKFGDHSPEDVYHFAHEGMDSLRAGGHLRAYRDPSEEAMKTYAMGGELKTHWGGHMEEMSENPYLPDGGVTYMPHGQSHDEADGNGRTGIGITYGDNPVEVERREPIMKLRDGSTGEDNLVVFGNLEIPKYGVEMLGDKKAKGMKFKNYVSDLSKSETKQNKTIQKSTEELDELNPLTSFDKLKFAGLQANVLGGNMKLKQIAQTKEKAAALQNAINDTAEEMGVDADSLAKGKVKTAKTGGKFSKAQVGGWYEKNKPLFMTDTTDNKVDMDAGELNEVKVPVKKIDYMRRAIASLSPKGVAEPNMTPRGSVVPDSAGMPMNEYEASNKPAGSKIHNYSWIEALNSVIPTLRPSDAEELNGNQLLGEMYALSNNQEEPVQAQQFSPELVSPYSISLQDQMNEITAQTRAAQRMAQGNPAAQAAIASQAYEAINKVKGEEFRMNQGMTDKVYTGNVAAINDAKLKNLGILDQQYARQAQAKSNTKAVTQAALNSISDKYARNEASNRKLQTYENMYNYRYDANGRLINMNELQQFNVAGNTSAKSLGKDAPAEGYEYIYDKNGKTIDVRKTPKATAKNGSIVKSIKNL